VTKLADDFGKERSLLAISSILIFFTVVLNGFRFPIAVC
jgi:hypothetical protein